MVPFLYEHDSGRKLTSELCFCFLWVEIYFSGLCHKCPLLHIPPAPRHIVISKMDAEKWIFWDTIITAWNHFYIKSPQDEGDPVWNVGGGVHNCVHPGQRPGLTQEVVTCSSRRQTVRMISDWTHCTVGHEGVVGWSHLWENLCSLPGVSNSCPTRGPNLISSGLDFWLNSTP